jgi:hypothetical protein
MFASKARELAESRRLPSVFTQIRNAAREGQLSVLVPHLTAEERTRLVETFGYEVGIRFGGGFVVSWGNAKKNDGPSLVSILRDAGELDGDKEDLIL